MTENTLYALNQVRQSHNTPDELEIISQPKYILYTKHFRKELNATNCQKTAPARKMALRT